MVSAPMHVRRESDSSPTDQPSLRIAPWWAWAFGGAVVLTYVCLLGHFALAEPDEPRYAEIAREMIALRDWVTPHLNYVKYFEKPPLVYWLTAINFELFGMSELVARAWPALSGLIGIGIAFALGRSMYDEWSGYTAAALLATTPFHFGFSQILVLDMPLSALMSVGLGAFWFAYTNPRRRYACVLLLYGATALGVLTKGPVAMLLSGAVILGFLVLQGELGALRWLLSPVGIVLFLAVALPWFVLVSQRNPEFVDFFVVKQHLDRFLRPDEHRQPLWFFVPIVLGGMLPWTLFTLLAPGITGRFVRRLVTRRVSAATLYCTVWSGVIFAFFSLSGSKLATYILPMFCPLAILAARFFRQVIARGRADVLRRGYVGVLVLAVIAILAAAIANEAMDDWQLALIVPRAYCGSLIVAGAAIIALLFLRRQALQASFATLLWAMLAVQIVAMTGRGVAAEYRPLAMAIRQQAAPEDQVITYGHYVQAIPFYAQRRTVMVVAWGELNFGSGQGDQSAFFWKHDARLVDAWRLPRHIFLVINRSELEQLRPRLEPAPRQIAAYGKKVVVVNFN